MQIRSITRHRAWIWLVLAVSAMAVLLIVWVTLTVSGSTASAYATMGLGSAPAGQASSTPVLDPPLPTPVPSALTCPAAFPAGDAISDTWVPQLPSGVDGTARLVPDQTPDRVVVCAYLSPSVSGPIAESNVMATSQPLTGSRELSGDLSQVVAALISLPPTDGHVHPCPLYLTSADLDHYLIGLSYPAARIWVSAPGNHCVGSSNGPFSTATNLRAQAATWYRSGTA